MDITHLTIVFIHHFYIWSELFPEAAEPLQEARAEPGHTDNSMQATAVVLGYVQPTL